MDLIVGMLNQDPKQRYTMQQIKAHPWFQGQMATKEDMKKHYYDCTGKNMIVDKQKNEALKAEYSKGLTVNRSAGDYKGASEQEITGWEQLEYKRMEFFTAGDKMNKGFYTSELGPIIFRALTEYLEGENYTVSSKKWKMTFNVRNSIEV